MADEIRQKLGLTQELMSSWLGVSRVRVAQAESGQRSLPLGRAVQLVRLTLATLGLVYDPAGNRPAPPPLPAPAPDPEPLQSRLAHCAHHAGRLRYELEQLRLKAAPYEARLAALPALRAYTGPVKDAAREANWLALLEVEAETALLYDCGAGPQKLLEARIAGLEREAEVLRELLEKTAANTPVSN
ncbi:XRE family transcriptional regulator [Hymenobacter aquaticus]|uniref:XRE family transcriptional regulator n=1 Tax=Hymenobacter aquaticus TaxID=1867101 RepID=A0A4Z0Q5K1_9BACT|nr:helix-turn-helix transcriptional regulator [Hymenobacter aquaticus]TGE24884.1 XRE family transcriptional regulator [Hymenobacter aquaticus]